MPRRLFDPLWTLRGLFAALCCAVVFTASPSFAEETPHHPFISPSESPFLHHHAARAAEAAGDPAVEGRWETLPILMPINPVHATLMKTGKVLIVSGSGNDDRNRRFTAGVWDPKTWMIRTFDIGWDMFCNGLVVLPDGRPFVLGGTLAYDVPGQHNFLGEPRTSVFDPLTETFSDAPNMKAGRWYPTGTVLGDGSVMVYSGLDVRGQLDLSVEIWNGSAFVPGGQVNFGQLELYPRQHLLPDGKVFECGGNPNSQMYDPKTQTFSPVATTVLPHARIYGSSVLLPLTPANGFKPKVMILGGGNPGMQVQNLMVATKTTELIDLSVPNPDWVAGPDMIKARVELNATLLPNGKVLVSGGSEIDEMASTAVKEAELYDPVKNTFSPAGKMAFPRLYHSNTLLLPDATVLAMGGNPSRGDYVANLEIYKPPYLFDHQGKEAVRPIFAADPPNVIDYSGDVRIKTPEPAKIAAVVLIRPGAPTHAFDMEQRLVSLEIKAISGSDELIAKGPANGNLAPPGFYLLFLLNEAGVPSIGKFVKLIDLEATVRP